MTVITEKETVKASEIEIPSDAITDGLSELAAETEKQPEAEQKSKSGPAPALVPPTEQEPEPTSEPEASHNNSEDMVYVPGFCWMESQGPNHVEDAERICTRTATKSASWDDLENCADVIKLTCLHVLPHRQVNSFLIFSS